MKVKFTKMNQTFEMFFIQIVYKLLPLILKRSITYKKIPPSKIQNSPLVGNSPRLRTTELEGKLIRAKGIQIMTNYSALNRILYRCELIAVASPII